MTTNASLPARFFGGQDQLKGPLPPELIAPGYRAEIAGFPAMDASAHGDFGRAFYAGFPDLDHVVDEVIVAELHVVARFTLRGTHSAALMGIPPTGRSITVAAMAIFDVENGRVTRLRAMFDQLGLMRQIGAVPA